MGVYQSTVPIPALDTREPTGQVPYPFILIEGEEGAGKTWCCAEFTASDKVGECYWLDWNEGAGDEYGPIGNYKIIKHDGTWNSIIGQVRAVSKRASEVKAAGGKPVVLIVDTLTAPWNQLKDWATARMIRSNAGKRMLAKDPDAELKPAPNMWNDARDKHDTLLSLLLHFEGIVVATAHGKQVAKFEDGKPVANQFDWSVTTQEQVPKKANAVIRLYQAGAPVLAKIRGLKMATKPGQGKLMSLPDAWHERGLEWFVFEALGFDPDTAAVRDLVTLDHQNVEDGLPTVDQAKEQMRVDWDDPIRLSQLRDQCVEADIMLAEVVLPGGGSRTVQSLLNERIRFLQNYDPSEDQRERESTPAPDDETEARGEATAVPESETPAADEAPAEQSQPLTADDATATRVPPNPHAGPGRSDLTQYPTPSVEGAPNNPGLIDRSTREPGDAEVLFEDEALFQAETLEVRFVDYVQPMLYTGEPLRGRCYTRAGAQRLLVGNRPRVAQVLRKQGMATAATALTDVGTQAPIDINALLADTERGTTTNRDE